ncbi:starch-binding domain-containing protein 1 isoform X1 [Sciurus carolinensis]|uniref:starch-binding domain-containing protein 1 isoform X1 n=1 Tax=Sciurus carolinensis TaxID=30640 RepID=UPI001FB510BA|nr:starch-binding domain-containing protein 1 isoform X1 [Sciurus carolinensis]
MGSVWSALLVGGGLAGALFVWLLRGGPGDNGKDGDAALGEAAAAGEDQDAGGGGLSPGSQKQELVTKPEHLQESNGHLISETKGRGNLQEASQGLQNPSGEHWDNARQHAPARQNPGTHSVATSEIGNSRGYSQVSRNESLESHTGEQRFQKEHDTPTKAATCFAQKMPSSNLLMNRATEVSLARLNSQDLTDHEDWEMVSRHSSWGDVGLGGSLEASMDCGKSTLVEARGWEMNGKTKKFAAMASESRQVNIRFQVHYITSTDRQFIAITGDHENLGRWKTYIPLHYHKDGFWSHSVFLPADTVVEWKFVLVENGGVTRWEECSNRLLETGHEDKVVQGLWGIH